MTQKIKLLSALSFILLLLYACGPKGGGGDKDPKSRRDSDSIAIIDSLRALDSIAALASCGSYPGPSDPCYQQTTSDLPNANCCDVNCYDEIVKKHCLSKAT